MQGETKSLPSKGNEKKKQYFSSIKWPRKEKKTRSICISVNKHRILFCGGVMVNVLDFNIRRSKFELQSCYYVYLARDKLNSTITGLVWWGLMAYQLL